MITIGSPTSLIALAIIAEHLMLFRHKTFKSTIKGNLAEHYLDTRSQTFDIFSEGPWVVVKLRVKNLCETLKQLER